MLSVATPKVQRLRPLLGSSLSYGCHSCRFPACACCYPVARLWFVVAISVATALWRCRTLGMADCGHKPNNPLVSFPEK